MSELQRMTARRAALFAVVAAMLVLAIAFLLDRPIASWSHDALHKPEWCKALTHIADIPVPAAMLGLAGAGVAWVGGWRPGAAGRVLLALCIATLAADSAKDVLKFAFGRPWPETWVNNNPSWIDTHYFGFMPFHGGAGYAAFPSGHTTRIATPCAILWRHAPRLRVAWLALPVLVAVGLIGCDYHFLSDCIAGALLGTACGVAVDRTIIAR